jgi:ribosomal protein L13
MLPKTVARVARFRNLKPYDNQKQQTTANTNKTPQT